MKYKNTWNSEICNDKRYNSCGNKLRTYIDYLKISLFLNRI